MGTAGVVGLDLRDCDLAYEEDRGPRHKVAWRCASPLRIVGRGCGTNDGELERTAARVDGEAGLYVLGDTLFSGDAVSLDYYVLQGYGQTLPTMNCWGLMRAGFLQLGA